MPRPRKSRLPADAFDIITPEPPKKVWGKWPTLVDDGFVSPPVPDTPDDPLPERPKPRKHPTHLKAGYDPKRDTANASKREKQLPLELRTKLAREVARQLAIWRMEVTRKTRPKFIEFCAKYGLGALQAQVLPNGDAAEQTPPGKLSVTEMQTLIGSLLVGTAAAAAFRPTLTPEVEHAPTTGHPQRLGPDLQLLGGPGSADGPGGTDGHADAELGPL